MAVSRKGQRIGFEYHQRIVSSLHKGRYHGADTRPLLERRPSAVNDKSGYPHLGAVGATFCLQAGLARKCVLQPIVNMKWRV
ncbi:hypothetical protein SPHINGO8AM_60099 [Sphingomonas sp. 8AM]|nr:hypothetical protein SPHINGO8AM_60099 [Sphingomonas sp. 8AM]